MRSNPILARSSSVLGALAALGAVVVIWAARLTVDGTVYVSELGSPALPTAEAFNAALLVLAAGGVLAGLGALGQRSTARLLGRWSIAASLITSGVAFLVASRVTCTAGCPVPFTEGATAQDLVHVVTAVIGFAAAAWAMLQTAFGEGPRPLRLLSRFAAVAVAAVAAAGGILSVLQFRTDIGAALEFTAMSIAVLWLSGFALSNAARPLRVDAELAA